MTARRVLVFAALTAWVLTRAVRDWWRGIDKAQLGIIHSPAKRAGLFHAQETP